MFEPIKINENQEEPKENVDYKKHIIQPDKINSDLQDFNSGKIPRGYKIGIPTLDNHFTFKVNEMMALVGKKGDGKTTIQLALQLCSSIVHDLIYVCAFQENEAWGIKMNCLTHLLGEYQDNILKSNPALHKQASDWFDEHFIFIDVESQKEATEVTKAIIDSGVKVYALIADPINSFENGWSDSGSEHKDDAVAGRKWLRFSKTVCSSFLSQHPTMSGQRQEGAVNSSQAEGGKVFNKAHFTWVINRPRGTNENELIVDNVRYKHTGGNETHPENPVVVHWYPTKIDISYKNGDGMYPDVIGYLIRKHNVFDVPMKEFEPGVPNMNPDEVF